LALAGWPVSKMADPLVLILPGGISERLVDSVAKGNAYLLDVASKYVLKRKKQASSLGTPLVGTKSR